MWFKYPTCDIIAENDPHLFHSLLSVGDRPVRKFLFNTEKIMSVTDCVLAPHACTK